MSNPSNSAQSSNTERSESEVPSRQEMFNRAWNGLRSQGWRKAMRNEATCTFLTADGLRCAWGWVDPEGTVVNGMSRLGGVMSLHLERHGIAGLLSLQDAEFASKMQCAHDDAGNGALRAAMVQFAKDYGLEIPSE